MQLQMCHSCYSHLEGYLQLGAHGLLLCLKSSLPLDLVNFTCMGLASVLTLDETLHGEYLGETGVLIWKDVCSYMLMAAFYNVGRVGGHLICNVTCM